MPHSTDFCDLLQAVAGLYDTEGRPGGVVTAHALRLASARPIDLPLTPRPPMPDELQAALALSRHPIAAKIAACLPILVWQHAGLTDGRITAEVAVQMLTCELIGPTGMVHDDTVRAGIFMQARGVAYTTRRHSAEETYFPLTGTARWSLNDSAPRKRPAGRFIFHPSMAPHATFTDERPMIALWRWSGEIGWDSYRMAG